MCLSYFHHFTDLQVNSEPSVFFPQPLPWSFDMLWRSVLQILQTSSYSIHYSKFIDRFFKFVVQFDIIVVPSLILHATIGDHPPAWPAASHSLLTSNTTAHSNRNTNLTCKFNQSFPSSLCCCLVCSRFRTNQTEQPNVLSKYFKGNVETWCMQWCPLVTNATTEITEFSLLSTTAGI